MEIELCMYKPKNAGIHWTLEGKILARNMLILDINPVIGDQKFYKLSIFKLQQFFSLHL